MDHPQIRVRLIASNKKGAGVFERMKKYPVSCEYWPPERWKDGNWIADNLEANRINLVVLAGFLRMIPKELVHRYNDRILNIHPALLPKFGGKGMYGQNVHQAVITSGENQSGITIHKVNEDYDKGEIIFQKEVDIARGMDADDLQKAVQKLEHHYYPRVIEEYING